MSREGFAGFATFADVLAYARTGAPLFYHAPLNYAPARLHSFTVRPRSIRIVPPGATGRGKSRTADPFTADKGHLSRFLRPVDAGAVGAS